jgi:hypothetical protein
MPASQSRTPPCEGSRNSDTNGAGLLARGGAAHLPRPPCGPVVNRAVHTDRIAVDRASHSGGAAPVLHRSSVWPRSLRQ